MEELNSKLAELEMSIKNIYGEISEREETEIKEKFSNLRATLFAEIRNKNTRSDVADDLIKDVERLEVLLTDATMNSRSMESIETRNNIDFLATEDLEEMEKRTAHFVGNNEEGKTIHKDKSWWEKIDSLCDRVASTLEDWRLSETSYEIKKIADELVNSHDINDAEIASRLKQKLDEIIHEMQEKEQSKERENKDTGIFTDLRADINTDEDMLKAYANQAKQESPEQPDLSQGNWIE